MNTALQQPWTAGRFLHWANVQEGRCEFDGIQPVAMMGGTARHSRVTNNIQAALRSRLRGSPCSSYGPDLGMRTTGEEVHFPDALTTWTPFRDADLAAPDPVVVFEVVSPTSGRTDRIERVPEYAQVPSILRYVIVETRYPGLLVLHRASSAAPWNAVALADDGVLKLPELSITIPVAETYEDVAFALPAADG